MSVHTEFLPQSIETRPDEVDLRFRGLDARPGFLLKSNPQSSSDLGNNPPSVRSVTRDLHHARSQASERFGDIRLAALRGNGQAVLTRSRTAFGKPS